MLRLPGKGEKKQPSLVQGPKTLYQGDARAGLPGGLKQRPKGSNLAWDVGHGREQKTSARTSCKAQLMERGPGARSASPQHLAVFGLHPLECRWSPHQGLPGWRAPQAAGLGSFPWCHWGAWWSVHIPCQCLAFRPFPQGPPQGLIPD